MFCENCEKKIERKTSNQKYCHICNGIVSKRLSRQYSYIKKLSTKTHQILDN